MIGSFLLRNKLNEGYMGDGLFVRLCNYGLSIYFFFVVEVKVKNIYIERIG